MKNSGKDSNTVNRTYQRGTLRKWLAGFLAATTAFTMLSGSAASLMAEEPATEFALAGAGSGQDVTVHFGNEEVEDINIHVNPETGAPEETLAGAGAETETESETEAETKAKEEAPTGSDLTVRYVDQFGDSIGEAYEAMPLPEFGESDTLSLVASKEYAPVADFAVWQEGTSKAIQYSFMRARIGAQVIRAIRKEEKAAASAEETNPSADEDVQTAEEDIQAAEEDTASAGAVYYYTTDNSEWKQIEDTDSIEFVFTNGKQTDYEFEDDNIKVTAKLQHAWAIPDGAQLKVAQITPQSNDYNYDAYMEALNAQAPAEASSETENEGSGSSLVDDSDSDVAKYYNEENTLLYDIAFIAVKYDEEGNPIEGSEYEYEPADGTVELSFEFKKSQLTDEIGISEDGNVAVLHLPLSQEVKDSVDTTAEAIDISSEDIMVEPVMVNSKAVVLQEGEADTIVFEAESFSTFVFVNDTNGQVMSGEDQNSWSGSKRFSMSDIVGRLGNITNYAVLAEELDYVQHIEGNIRVKDFNIKTKYGNWEELNAGANVHVHNNPDRFTVTQKLENATEGIHHFYYSFVDDVLGTSLYHFEMDVTVGQGQTSGSAAQKFVQNEKLQQLKPYECIDNVFYTMLELHHSVSIYQLENVSTTETPERTPVEGGKINHDDGGTVFYGALNSVYTAGEIGNSTMNYVVRFNNMTGTEIGTDTDKKLFPLTMSAYPDADHVSGGFVCLAYDADDSCKNFKLNNTTLDQLKSNPQFQVDPDLEDNIDADLDRVAALSTEIAKAINGATDTTNNNAAERTDLNVINIKSTNGSLAADLAEANFAIGRDYAKNIIDGLIDNNEYLLINIDASDFPSAYTIDGGNIYYDGESPGNSEYPEIASRIIINVVKADDPGHTRFSPYTGYLTLTGEAPSVGMVLAPRATIDKSTTKWIGELIGKKVIHDGPELHKMTVINSSSWMFNIDLINKYPTYTELSLEKIWSDISMNNHEADTVTVKVYQIMTPVDREGEHTPLLRPTESKIAEVQLKKDNGWKVDLSEYLGYELPKDIYVDGIEYYCTYYVEEIHPKPGYKISYTYNGVTVKGPQLKKAAVDGGEIVINNELEATKVIVEKKWVDDDNHNLLLSLSEDEKSELKATVRLYRKSGNSQITEVSGIDPIELLVGNEWKGEWNDLPKKDDNGNDYEYFVREEPPVQGFSIHYKEADSTNTYGRAKANPGHKTHTAEITNAKKTAYALPATGGEGTRMIYLLSITLIALAGAGLIMIRRRREMSR